MKKLFLIPTLLLAQTTHSVDLAWEDTVNPAGTVYNVYKSTGDCASAAAFSKIASAVVSKSYSDKNVPTGKFCYYVTAASATLESPPSQKAGADVPAISPTNLKITVTISVSVP